MDIGNLLKKDLEELCFEADKIRMDNVGDIVHIRALLEISNICKRNCAYCGLRTQNQELSRYALSIDEIGKIGKSVCDIGYKTIVLQSGENNHYDIARFSEMVAELVNNGIVVTLSLGELSFQELKLLKEAGTKRYLLKFETADKKLYEQLHKGYYLEARLDCLSAIRELGYEVGSGFLVGLPGENEDTIIDNLLLLEKLQCNMAGIGVFIPHKQTPLSDIPHGNIEITKKCVAISRMLLPKCNIPITTSLGEFGDKYQMFYGGANVIMQNITPQNYADKYQIYPKPKIIIDWAKDRERLEKQIKKLGRTPV